MKLVKLLAVAAVLAVAGSAYAAEAAAEAPKKAGRTKGLRGKIVKVEDGKITVKTMARGTTESKEVTVATDDKTVVTLDKKEAKVADLKVDMYVHVTPAEGTATKISAMTKAPEPRKPKADQPKPAE
jgi:hypothetical protein